jgi:hypothetical protein
MSKSDDRAALERLMANFKGETKICPPKAQTDPVKKRKVKKAAPDGRLEAAETAMRTIAAPVQEAKDLTKDGSAVDLGGMTRYAEADYDVAKGPRDHAHRSWRMPKDKRSRRHVEMLLTVDNDDVWDDEMRSRTTVEKERERRFRTAAKTGTHCGVCGKTLEPNEPVWRIRRRYESDKVEIVYEDHPCLNVFETEEVVAPICSQCWSSNQYDELDHGRDPHAGTVMDGPCGGCGRMVYIARKALKSWLAHGKHIYCCDDCSRRPVAKPAFKRTCETCGRTFSPKRLDARFCKPACRVAASRRNKSA